MVHNYRSLSAKHSVISVWFPECDIRVGTFSRYWSFHFDFFLHLFCVPPPLGVPASVDIYWWQLYTITGHIVTDWHLAQGYAPTIENRRRASSPCPLLDNLGWPDPHPAPWLFPFICLFWNMEVGLLAQRKHIAMGQWWKPYSKQCLPCRIPSQFLIAMTLSTNCDGTATVQLVRSPS